MRSEAHGEEGREGGRGGWGWRDEEAEETRKRGDRGGGGGEEDAARRRDDADGKNRPTATAGIKIGSVEGGRVSASVQKEEELKVRYSSFVRFVVFILYLSLSHSLASSSFLSS